MQALRDNQLDFEIRTDIDAQTARLHSLIQGAAKGDTDLPKAHALIGRMCSTVMQELEIARGTTTRGVGGMYKKWLRELPLDIAAVIAIRECIRICSSMETMVLVQDLALSVGKLWELEVRIRQAEVVNKVYMGRVHDQIKDRGTREVRHIRNVYNVAIERVFQGNLDLSLGRTDMIHLGKFGVDACVQSGLIEVVHGTNSKGTMVRYDLTPDVKAFLHDYSESDVRHIISREDTRMMCAPDDWHTLGDGGYLSVRRKAVAPLMNVLKIRKSERNAVAKAYTAQAMPTVFEVGNYLQSIPYELHDVTRAATIRVWQSGGNVMGVPSTTGPVRPDFPFHEDWVSEGAPEHELEAFKVWKRSVAIYHTSVREWRGKVREVGAFLKHAKTADGACWFPVYFDTRGRWYYRGVPNPQGSDLAKAVIHFNKKKPLTHRGLFWLKVHIANSYGYDKERFEDRARWTEQNWAMFERALDDPENHPEVWGADAPWCTFAACWELRNALRSPQPHLYETGIPIHMDATCSGLQHFSALLRDPVGARYVNLDDPLKCGPKQDIYSKVAMNTLEMIKLDLDSSDAEIAELAAWCLKVGISRNMAKKPVMTYVYGATLRGTADHIEYIMNKEALSASGMAWRDTARSFKDCIYIARKLFQGIAAAVPAAAAAMQWLRDTVKQVPNGKRMTWRTASGFIVQHDYQDYTEKRVRLNSCGVQLVTIRDWAEGTIPDKMQSAIAPNFIHALDATHLTLTVKALKDADVQVVTIHDSFGTHPSDVDTMHRCIREEFVKMYSGPNVLAEFLWEVGCVGEVPTRGSFNLEEVLDSEFFFS